VSRQNIYDNEEFFKGYFDLRKADGNFNDLIERPALQSLLPPVSGLRILDLGCGFGELCRDLAEQGAGEITGVDISTSMLAEAERRSVDHSSNIRFIRMAMEDVDFPADSFDMVVSSFAFQYIENFDALVAKIEHWLTAGGYLVFSIEHPTVTGSPQRWCTDESGKRLHWPLDRYGMEGRQEYTWFVDGVIKYHRRFDTTINTLIDHGLIIERVYEPIPDDDIIARYPSYADQLMSPSLFLVRARKQAGNR